MPPRGWKDIASRVKASVKRDRVPLASAGVAFYAMLALFPTLTAFLSLYGLFADPVQVETQLDLLVTALPGAAAELVAEQVDAIIATDSDALTIGLAVSVLVALWTASTGAHGLMEALTLASGETETRGFVKRRAVAVGLTLAGMAFFAAAVAVVVVAPPVLQAAGLGAATELIVRVLRWAAMVVVLLSALALIYRSAPDRSRPRWRWVSPGSLAAAALWIVGSMAFSFYVANFGSYNETYGALGAFIVLLLWLFLSAFVVLLGAEINSEFEHPTHADSTSGEPAPQGQRSASVADDVGASVTQPLK